MSFCTQCIFYYFNKYLEFLCLNMWPLFWPPNTRTGGLACLSPRSFRIRIIYPPLVKVWCFNHLVHISCHICRLPNSVHLEFKTYMFNCYKYCISVHSHSPTWILTHYIHKNRKKSYWKINFCFRTFSHQSRLLNAFQIHPLISPMSFFTLMINIFT